MARVSQSIYSPLPQSISDSDSEKEMYMDPVCSSYGNQGSFNGKIPTLRKAHGAHFEKLRDEIPKVQKVSPKFTPLRKCVFTFSILMCFLPIVLFLWVLPCSELNSCKRVILNWENRLMNIELKGSVNLIHGVYNDNLNLALLYEGSKIAHEELNDGVISFLGNSGGVAWNFRQEIIPKMLDCSLIDVNGDGFSDCLLLDERGLKVLGTISGEIIWHVHSHEEGKTICDLEFPVKVSDLNMDNVNELLMVYKHESLLVVCGQSGKALRNIVLPCKDVRDLNLLGEDRIRYTCYNTSENFMFSLEDLKRKFNNESYHIEFSRVNGTAVHAENIETLKESRRRLVIEVQGSYPNCSTMLTLFDDVLGEKILTWNLDNAYISEAKNFSLQLTNRKSSLPNDYVGGFVFKLWKWSNVSVQNAFTAEFPTTNNSYIVNNITEQVVMIAYNNSTNTFNVSVQDITQLCFTLKGGNTCQPNLMYQRDSILLADLASDGVQELVTYSVSFVSSHHNDSQKKKWDLVSTIAVTNLEKQVEKALLDE